VSVDKRRAIEIFHEFLLEAIEKGTAGDYVFCSVIVEAFRQHKGDEAANKVRSVLWQMIKESTN